MKIDHALVKKTSKNRRAAHAGGGSVIQVLLRSG
jgi:hypothetical protein